MERPIRAAENADDWRQLFAEADMSFEGVALRPVAGGGTGANCGDAVCAMAIPHGDKLKIDNKNIYLRHFPFIMYPRKQP